MKQLISTEELQELFKGMIALPPNYFSDEEPETWVEFDSERFESDRENYRKRLLASLPRGMKYVEDSTQQDVGKE